MGVLLTNFIISLQDQGASAKKTLKSAWFRWCMEFHGFSMLQLSDSDVAGLSGAVREFLMSESDIVAGGGNYGEELDRASRTRNILPSLKYFFPQVPKPNEKPRALTNDQKMQNQIYMREARKLWRKAGKHSEKNVICSINTLLCSLHSFIAFFARCVAAFVGEELNNRVVEYVAKAMNGGSKKGGFDHAESESKGKAEYDNRGDFFLILFKCCPS